MKSSLENPAYEASLPRTVTYAIYLETRIMVLGQLLISSLILIKQGLPKRKHHLFHCWADSPSACSIWTLGKTAAQCSSTLSLRIVMQFGKPNFVSLH